MRAMPWLARLSGQDSGQEHCAAGGISAPADIMMIMASYCPWAHKGRKGRERGQEREQGREG